MKTDEITIKITGATKFRQEIVNRIFELIEGENLAEQTSKPGCGIEITSTLEPDWDEIL